MSDRELVVRRSFDAPARLIFEAWTRPDLFRRWWAPASSGVLLRSCKMDVRAGGEYRLEFGSDASSTWTFFGRYIEVTPHSRLVWTNEEGDEEGAVSTVTFEEREGRTLLVLRDLYPTREALDAAVASGSTSGFSEQFEQLDQLLLTLHSPAPQA